MALSGCMTPSVHADGNYKTPIGRSPVTANPTAYSDALVCLGAYAREHHLASPRLAVGRISDYTGKVSLEGGREITQGASLMAMTALAKAGARQVERFDTSVGELELKYANNKLITDDAVANPNHPADYRKIMAGQVAGSDFFIVGGITELNYNIQSSGLDAYAGDTKNTGIKGLYSGRTYVMNVALDLRLVDTRTLEVVDVISYQKQIVGREIQAGVFDILNGNIFDIDGGQGALEPMQLAVRAMIERATLEFMANLYGVSGPDICLDPKNDFLENATMGPTGGLTPAYNNLETNNASTRADPTRWENVAADRRAESPPPADDRDRRDHGHDGGDAAVNDSRY
ncbi:holdfast anchoring protein HfaB [Asticcacaulis sp. EMRT-3]|uniref:holdfast anchoring protein HfaB n=1 Tax=Asticcacaulis sp. EMRT-3 TaxID=3040349 RepID=UPI0024AFAB21|nr:holdfast anchoring protein HfaB [Asticcacaulis sp. EMRT-3]MDI7774154.1 holdfast anchoring protein HfaB [Asticcacaulis sp. EMRT-3]